MGTSQNDIIIMAKTIWGEARGEDYQGQVAVGWVIRNRCEEGGWFGNSIREVCLKPYQFECWNSDNCNKAQMDRLTENSSALRGMMAISKGNHSQHHFCHSFSLLLNI